ncbi:nucleoside-specific channel-forming protein Tsx [Trinickia terrae]|uniref:Nucleoside-specific channel-forming protein Tsx n=1 Tax=Trinickia terrae TaxID=2571161 RepID=A0A4U1HW59_9BURK|nr:nucleoside-specific channel-forming protein Tsx [Trinickia terrae]TKC85939.1 nucleoside-specific channel-forming protein Tsx [Trinickia terrae]
MGLEKQRKGKWTGNRQAGAGFGRWAAALGAVLAVLTGVQATTCAYAQESQNQQVAESGAVIPPPQTAPASPYMSDWFHQSLGLIGSKDIRFGPYKTSDIYLEYEYFGRKGPFDLYGYVDVPRVLGEGSAHDTGITNRGSPLFTEQEPRVSIDDLVGHHLGFGPFKEWYAAFDWIYDQGHKTSDRQNTLYAGIGTDIDVHLPVFVSANLYVRRQWENYGAANQNTWDGYRAQMKYIYPIGTYYGGHLTYVGFFNYDFGSKLQEETGDNTRSDNAFVSTNVLVYSFTHWRFWGAARYFHNGGQWNGSDLNFGDGTFHNHGTGWGYYASVGYQF